MKTLFLALTIFCASLQADPAVDRPGGHYVIGLTPFLEKSAKDDVYRRIVGMILENLPLKSSLSIFDAYYLTNITRIDIPDVRAFESGKTRANQFREQVYRLRQFLAAEHEHPAAAQVKLNFDNAVRFPQFMDFLGENVSHSEPLTVIVIGSPLYVDAKEPGFSMADGYFPSDGHLLAARDKSVFGLRAREHALKNVTVHFGYLGDPWVSAIHQEKIARFWTLYLAQQDALLATFCGDMATLFNAARGAPSSRLAVELDRSQTKVEMLRISRDVGAADWITRDSLSEHRPPPPTKTVGPMKIGIRWKGEIDLDLYAAASPDAETLFFEHTRAPEGYYFKDHRNSPDREYEFIEFENPVDIWRVQAHVNFYKGNTSAGPRGEIRIEFDGRIYSSKFQIEATHGNKGRDGSSQAAYWTPIDVPGILGLRTARN